MGKSALTLEPSLKDQACGCQHSWDINDSWESSQLAMS